MYLISQVLVVLVALCPFVYLFTPLGREKRNVIPGPSHYNDATVASLQTIRIQHGENGVCLEPKSNVIEASACDSTNSAQLFRMDKGVAYAGMLQHVDSGRCLSLDGSDRIILSSCSTVDQSSNVWKCHFPYVKQGSSWLERDWAGLTTMSGQKCVAVTRDKQVKAKDCTKYGKNVEEKIFVHGKKFMGVCATAGYIAPRTNDTNYYYFYHSKFSLPWSMKYIEVYMVYNNGVYKAFRTEYGGHDRAMRKIRQHAMDAMNIVDKMYQKAKIRVILKGFEVWDKKDLANTANTTTSWQVHGNFRAYSRKLRYEKGLKYDVAIHVFDKNLYGAAGTASSHYCSQSSYNEVFTMTTLGGRDRVIARQLANILTHELAHHLRSGHNFDPTYTCPTYHLFGGCCTLGGNDWPKAFSAGELESIRYWKFSCLDNKPKQSSILGCGDGVVEPGEECDCGSSEDCLKRNPCCEGSICKLKRSIGAECSNEACCSNCKFDERKNGCGVQPIMLQGNDFGEINQNNEVTNIRKAWHIKVSSTKRVTLIMNLLKFEFDEGCPYDHIEVRDGSDATSPLIGRYCRSLMTMNVKSSSNELYIKYKGDSSFASHFKLIYTATNTDPDGAKELHIKTSDGKCFTTDYSRTRIRLDSNCQEKFIWTNKYHFKNIKTGLCLQPTSWYGNYNPGNEIILTGDCSNHGAVFISTSQGTIVHAASGYCLYNSGWRISLSYCSTSSSKIFRLITATGPTLPPTTLPPSVKPPKAGDFRIRHYSKLCFNYDKNDNKIHLTTSCDDYYHWGKNKMLVHSSTGKCVEPQSSDNDSPLILVSNCDDGSRFESTPAGSLKHTQTGSCVHPHGGSMYPPNGQLAVIYGGCDELRLKFTIEPVAPTVRTFIIKHFSGLCVKLRTSNNRFHLTSSCDERFSLTQTNALKHMKTGKCAVPESNGDNARVTVSSTCDVSSRFEQTKQYSMKHISTGKCVHPLGGSLTPRADTDIVIYAGCDQNRLQFKFIWD